MVLVPSEGELLLSLKVTGAPDFKKEAAEFKS